MFRGVAHPWYCDAMGHMTTRFYMGMFDDASYHLLDAAFPASREQNGLGWADVRHEIDYLAEVAAGDLLEIRAVLRRVGGKSIGAGYTMHNVTRGGIAATLVATTVLFDLEKRVAVRLPDGWRDSAAALLAADPA